MEKSNTQSVMDESYMCIQINRFFQQENVSRETFSCLLLHSVSEDGRTKHLGYASVGLDITYQRRHALATHHSQRY